MKCLLLLCLVAATISAAPQGQQGYIVDGTAPISKNNQVPLGENELFELASPSVLHRERRGLMDWFKRLVSRSDKRINTEPIVSNDLPSEDSLVTSRPSSTSPPAPRETEILSYHGDSDVNYLGVQPRHNSDAEIIDVNLLRDADTYTRTPKQPSVNQPMIYEPIRSHRSYHGDTNVNYIDVQPRHNPDAEVFDIELIKEDNDKLYAKRTKPIQFQPLARRQPFMSRPISSHRSYHGDMAVNYFGVQTRSDPDAEVFDTELTKENGEKFHARRFETMRRQPVLSQPMRSHSMRSHPSRFNGLTYD